MSLKLAIVAVVMTLAVFSQSGASDVKALQDDIPNVLPGFSYLKQLSLLRKLLMSAAQGDLQGFQQIQNLTEWQPTVGANWTTVKQLVKFPDLKAYWNTTKASMGLLNVVGPMVGALSDSTFDLTMNATSSGNGTCQLDLQVLLNTLTMQLNLQGLGIIGALVSPLLTVVTGLVSLLVNLLTGVLGGLLTGLIGGLLPADALVALCQQIMSGNITDMAGGLPIPVPIPTV